MLIAVHFPFSVPPRPAVRLSMARGQNSNFHYGFFSRTNHGDPAGHAAVGDRLHENASPATGEARGSAASGGEGASTRIDGSEELAVISRLARLLALRNCSEKL